MSSNLEYLLPPTTTDPQTQQWYAALSNLLERTANLEDQVATAEANPNNREPGTQAANYTLQLSDAGQRIRRPQTGGAGDITYTFDDPDEFEEGTTIEFSNGAGGGGNVILHHDVNASFLRYYDGTQVLNGDVTIAPDEDRKSVV